MNNGTIKLTDLQDLFNNKHRYIHSEQKGHQGIGSRDYEGCQGEYNETFKFYKHSGLPNNMFLRETYHTNSYGNEDSLVKIEFVKGVEKQITIFEPIN